MVVKSSNTVVFKNYIFFCECFLRNCTLQISILVLHLTIAYQVDIRSSKTLNQDQNEAKSLQLTEMKKLKGWEHNLLTCMSNLRLFYFSTKLLEFLHGTLSSFKEHCPKFFPLICTSFTCGTLVQQPAAPFLLTLIGGKRKLWATFFEWTEGPMQRKAVWRKTKTTWNST